MKKVILFYLLLFVGLLTTSFVLFENRGNNYNSILATSHNLNDLSQFLIVVGFGGAIVTGIHAMRELEQSKSVTRYSKPLLLITKALYALLIIGIIAFVIYALVRFNSSNLF